MKILEKFYQISKKPVPYYAKYSISTLLWKPIRKFINVVIAPLCPFNCVRIFLYRLVGFKIGKNVFIGMRGYLDDINPSRITIGDNVVMSYGCYFSVHGKGQQHTYITIKNNAYVGMRVIFVGGKKGITIGEGAIIGAGALVNKDVPDGCTFAGVPAKDITKAVIKNDA